MYELNITWRPATEKPENRSFVLMLCKSKTADIVYVRDGEYCDMYGFFVSDVDADISFNEECIGWIYYDDLIPTELRKEN